MSNTTTLACADLGFAWPDGAVVFDGFSMTVPPGRTGLVGANGSGKSTLLRLLAGDLKPAAGGVTVSGELAYLRQNVTLDTRMRVDEVLGIARVRKALRAIESGDVAEEHFAIVGDDWDVEERARAELERLGLGHVETDRRIGELSGGEATLLCLAAQFLKRPAVLLLDEPTNNLDRAARERFVDAVAAWSGTVLVVSHDRELLGHVDRIADLRAGELHWYGGNFTDYETAVAAEREAADRVARTAEADLKKQKRELAAARVALDRRVRYGQKDFENKRRPKTIMQNRKQQAQVSAGKYRLMHQAKLAKAEERLGAAENVAREDDEIRVDLPETTVPAGRTVLTLTGVRLRTGTRAHLEIRGPERIALVGPNGAGKTTLLRTIAGQLQPLDGQVRVSAPLRYLPQRLDLLDDAETVAGNVARFAPAATGQEIRAQLARFLFRGHKADQPAGTLSGGERFRATLAALLLADPAPRLLLLDEPTNNLDLASVRRLTEALRAYRGALLVASHDVTFLRELGLTRWLRLDGDLGRAW